MKILANKKWRNKDFRYLSEVKTYQGLSKEEIDIATNGIPFEGARYPLCYVFWGDTRKYRNVQITLTGETGTLIGESIFASLSRYVETSIRGIVKVEGGRITDLSYSVLQFM